MKQSEINESLSDFLSILNGSGSYNTPLGKAIQERINYVKTHEEDEYMNFIEEINDARYEGRMEGLREGEMKVKDSVIATMLNKYSLDEIAMCVSMSKDEVLERIEAMGLNCKSDSIEP